MKKRTERHAERAKGTTLYDYHHLKIMYILYVCSGNLRMCRTFFFGIVCGYMRHIAQIPMVLLPIHFPRARILWQKNR